jgi:molybdopterin converting factor small subunit
MKVNLKCFAKLAEGDVCDFTGSDEHALSNGETVRDLVKRLGIKEEEVKLIFLNNKKADFDTLLKDGDQLALSPPVAGM